MEGLVWEEGRAAVTGPCHGPAGGLWAAGVDLKDLSELGEAW